MQSQQMSMWEVRVMRGHEALQFGIETNPRLIVYKHSM